MSQQSASIRRVAAASSFTLVLGLGVGGCARDLNARPTLGGSESIPALAADTDAGPPTRDEPSLASIDRAEWAARRFVVPVDGTVHGPIHRWESIGADNTARHQGLFPTAETALDTGRGDGGMLRLEALLAPGFAFLEIAWMPVSLVISAPAQRVSPGDLYKRYPDGQSWTSASAPAAEGAMRPETDPGETPDGG